MSEELLKAYEDFKGNNVEFKEILILNKDGSIKDKSENINLEEEFRKKIIQAWDNHEGSMMISLDGQELRYIILKSDPLQLACVKPGSGKAIVGTSRNNLYGIAFLEDCKNVNASSVYFQKFIIDYI